MFIYTKTCFRKKNQKTSKPKTLIMLLSLGRETSNHKNGKIDFQFYILLYYLLWGTCSYIAFIIKNLV